MFISTVIRTISFLEKKCLSSRSSLKSVYISYSPSLASFSLSSPLFLPHNPRSRSHTHLLQALPRAARGSHPSRHLHRPGPLRRSSPVKFWHWWGTDTAHALSLSISPCTPSRNPVFGMSLDQFLCRQCDRCLPKWTENESNSFKKLDFGRGGLWNSRNIEERIPRTLCRSRREGLFW